MRGCEHLSLKPVKTGSSFDNQESRSTSPFRHQSNGADVNTIYMVKRPELSTILTGDVYDEYIVVNGAWEQIGNTKVDLSNYVEKVVPTIQNVFAGLDAAGALLDTGIAIKDVEEHLENNVIHIPHYSAGDGTAENRVEEQICSGSASGTETLRHRYCAGNRYLHGVRQLLWCNFCAWDQPACSHRYSNSGCVYAWL